MKAKVIIAASAALFLGVPVAQAADKEVGGFYVLGSVGQGKMKPSNTNNGDDTGTNTAYKFQLGYRINRWIGFEGGYVNFGKINLQDPGFSFRSPVNAEGWDLSIVPSFPLGDDFLLLTKIGVASVKNNESGSSRAMAVYGVGLNYIVNDNFDLRAEYEFYKGPNPSGNEPVINNIGVWTMGAAYRF